MAKIRVRTRASAENDGYAKWWPGGKAWIDIHPDLPPKEQLVTLCHELGHVIFDDETEKHAAKCERLGRALWAFGYRLVLNKETA